jgi:hypothetical protein
MLDKEFNLYYLGDFIYKIKFIIIIFLILGYAIGYFIKDDPIIEKSGRFEFDTISYDIREINDLTNIVLTNKLLERLNFKRIVDKSGAFIDVSFPRYEIFKADINYAFLLDALSIGLQSETLKKETVNSLNIDIDKKVALETLSSINYKYQNKETAKSNFVTFAVADLKTNLNEEDFRELLSLYFINLKSSINNLILARIDFLYNKQQEYNKSVKEYIELAISLKIEPMQEIKTLEIVANGLETIINNLASNKNIFISSLAEDLNNDNIRLLSTNSLKISYFVKNTDDKITILISILISFILSILLGYFYYLRIKKIS